MYNLLYQSLAYKLLRLSDCTTSTIQNLPVGISVSVTTQSVLPLTRAMFEKPKGFSLDY